MKTFEEILLDEEADRCRRCLAGELVDCDGGRIVLDKRATEWYGTTKLRWVPCPHWGELKARRRRAQADTIMGSGLPTSWAHKPPPNLSSVCAKENLGLVCPQELDAALIMRVTETCQAAVYSRLLEGRNAHYVFCPGIAFDTMDEIRTLMSDGAFLCLDRWDGGGHPPSLISELSALLESRLTDGLPTIVGLLRPFNDVVARVPDEEPVIGLLSTIPREVINHGIP